jgi:hypothetical protein
MFSNKKKLFFLTTLGFFLLLCAINLFALDSSYEEIFLDINQSIFEPIFVWSISLFVISICMLFFSKEVFNSWFKKIFSWYLPLGLIITFLADTSVSYTFPNKVGFAMLLGEILVAVTLVFALVQRFVYKK